MTQTAPDIATASEPELRRWLAEQPCPDCDGGLLEQMCACGDEPDLHMKQHELCDGLGLAFPWASEKCIRWHGDFVFRGCPDCKGSGRVPKEFGLSLLIVETQNLGCYDALADAVTAQVREKWSTESEIMLAALQAVAQAAMR